MGVDHLDADQRDLDGRRVGGGGSGVPADRYLPDPTAAALEQASTQATASAAAYEAAFAGTVPPAAIAANRAQLATLVATNFLGINTPAITATEAQYAAYWVQDTVTYAAYQAASAASSVLTPVTPLASTSNPAAAATADSAAVATGGAASTLQNAAASLPSLPFTTTGLLGSIDNFIGTPSVLNVINGSVNTAAWWVCNTIPTAVSLGHTFGTVPSVAVSDVMPAGPGGIVEGLTVGSVAPAGGMSAVGAAASASVGEAGAVGGLSVPAGWSAAAPATLASSTAPLEGSGWTVASEAAGGAPVTAMPGMPGGMAAARGAGALAGPRYGFKPIVMPKQVVV